MPGELKAILGKKLGMTQTFDADGAFVPVTVIEAKPNIVAGIRTKDQHGYQAVQLAYEEVPERKLNKPVLGFFRKVGIPPCRYLREVRLDGAEGIEVSVGDRISVDVFEQGDVVHVTGVSKGKGFAGVIKRHGFAGGPASHGSMFHRAPGSIGASSFPSKVFKGKRMPGRMGQEKITQRNLKVVRVDAEKSLLFVRGSVPGNRGSVLLIRGAELGG